MKHVLTHLHHSKNQEVNEMYVAMSMRSFAVSLIGIFVPIYLFTLGYSLRTIFLFYIMANAFQFVGDYLAGHAIARYGAKHLIIISYPAMVINLAMLTTLQILHWPLWSLALTMAVALNLFWVPYHDDFSEAKNKMTTGKQVGNWVILSEVSGALGPLIGGFIAQKFGIQYGILVALAIILVAIIPLIGKHEIVSRKTFRHSALSVKKYYKDLIAYGGVSFEGMTLGVIWPLFLYLFFKNYVKVGIIVTLSLILVTLLSFAIGKMTDKYGNERAMKTGSMITFFTAGSRIFALGTNMAYVISTISSLSNFVLLIPFYSVFYAHADKEPRTEYVTLMEMTVDVSRVVLYGVLYLATFLLANRWIFIVAFIFAAFGALLSQLIARSQIQKNEKPIKKQEISRARV